MPYALRKKVACTVGPLRSCKSEAQLLYIHHLQQLNSLRVRCSSFRHMDCEVGVRHGGLENKGVSKLGQSIINLKQLTETKMDFGGNESGKERFLKNLPLSS